MKTNTSKDSYK